MAPAFAHAGAHLAVAARRNALLDEAVASDLDAMLRVNQGRQRDQL